LNKEKTMRHLIVAVHPRRRSFNRSVVNAYRGELEEAGHKVECRDLYAMKFAPLLTTRDVGITPGRRPPRDVAREQAAIRRANVITFVAPLWWSGVPAMLKGYLDRVFCAGFAYVIDKQGNYRPAALKGKRATIVITSGATTAELRAGGTLKAIQNIYGGLLQFCGVKVLGQLYLTGIEPGMSRHDGERHLAAVRQFTRRTFKLT
jgi:NAD(P)H dehydrogenase (quinone)